MPSKGLGRVMLDSDLLFGPAISRGQSDFSKIISTRRAIPDPEPFLFIKTKRLPELKLLGADYVFVGISERSDDAVTKFRSVQEAPPPLSRLKSRISLRIPTRHAASTGREYSMGINGVRAESPMEIPSKIRIALNKM
jgi:hypothetical protein